MFFSSKKYIIFVIFQIKFCYFIFLVSAKLNSHQISFPLKFLPPKISSLKVITSDMLVFTIWLKSTAKRKVHILQKIDFDEENTHHNVHFYSLMKH